MFEDVGGVNESSTPTVHTQVVPRNKAVREGKGKLFVGSQMSFLNTDDIVVLDEMVKSIRNGKTTLKGTRTRRVKRDTTNVVRENPGKRKGRRGQRRGRRGGRGRGKGRVRGSGGLEKVTRHYGG